MESMEEKKELLKQMLREGTHVVAYIGDEMVVEAGFNCFTVDDIIYDTEAKYGYDLNQLNSARFYETRTSQFYDFYRNEIIQHHEPSIGFKALAKLQMLGKLKSIVSHDIYMLAKRAGCEKTIELTGTIFDNSCQKCGKAYPIEYIEQTNQVPLCKTCKVKIRPNLLLVGETINNVLMTKAANTIEKADVLLVLGAHLNDEKARRMIRYYLGNKLVVIHRKIGLIDERADLFIQGEINEIISEIVDSLHNESITKVN